jgi:hypothetical protein
MSWTVRVQSAAGTAREIRVHARSESAAVRAALRQCDPDYRAIWALPA